MDGKFLLVRGRRYANQFQPVGGVYKVLGSGAAQLRRWGALGDDLLPLANTGDTDDLRLRLKGKHLPAFLRWFDSGEGRETCPWREFHEELLGPGLLPDNSFTYTNHTFVRRHINPIRYSAMASSPELLMADVFDLQPTGDQETSLRALMRESRPEVLWASAEQIHRQGAVPGRETAELIAPTAAWTL